MLINRASLSQTVDGISALLFDGRTLTAAERGQAADSGLMRCLERAAKDPRNGNPGLYCCGKCSVGLWRNLLAGGLDRNARQAVLCRQRSMDDADTRWPFER